MRKAVFISLVTLAFAACGCKNKSAGSGGGTGSATGGDAAACGLHEAHVRQLYASAAKAAAKADEKPKVTALREQEVADNTEMALGDCRKQPLRFAPCLEKARSVEELERECLAPLDDAGKVEGDYFEKRGAETAP